MSTVHAFFATAARGLEPLLVEELRALGASDAHERRGGAQFSGPLELAYRACLWSRTASRLLLPLGEFAVDGAEALYQGVAALPWEDHLDPDGTLAVDFHGSAPGIGHTRFGAQRVKDAIVDRLRERHGRRPSVDRDTPDLRINAHLHQGRASIAIDLSGDSLHRRGYRVETVAAPLKESLAAALLLKAGWPALAGAGAPLLDPMCGSGTLAIEAALMAADIAPGLNRRDWGFSRWLEHRPAIWRGLCEEAHGRREAGLGALPPITACDQDALAVRAARANIAAAGLGGRILCERRAMAASEPPDGAAGLLIVNPPYGERLGAGDPLHALYADLGKLLKERFGGWQAAVFTGNPELGREMGLRAHKVNAFYNGALECRLLQFRVSSERFVDRDAAAARARRAAYEAALADGADAFANRLRRNQRTLGRWAEREGIECYRLYDADIPEYAVAIDRYGSRLHVQEYAPPRSIDPQRAEQRLEQVMTVLPEVLGLPAGDIHLKVRRRQKGEQQYTKLDARGEFHTVTEGRCRLLVNLTDYLDTGLFLDHRRTREMIGTLAKGRRFLNLFAYTGTATVHAALGGARETTSVDLSQTYLDWAQRNLALNGIQGPAHRLVRANCLEWMRRERGRYDLIFLDPPTFSNSKRMDDTLDVQRDHVGLIRDAVALLAPGGELIFSNNNRRFRMDTEALAELRIEDISRATLPHDFERNPRIHNCWRISRTSAAWAGRETEK